MCELSIIVPVYNVEKYLPACIESILRNKTSQIELILVDDGSSDCSGKVCDAYAKQDTRVCVIHQPNSGVSVARNNGMQQAHGTWLTFVDSDDLLTDNAVDVMLSHTSDSADFVVFGFDYYQEGQSAPPVQADWSEMRFSCPEELSLYRRAVLFKQTGEEARLQNVPLSSVGAKMIRNAFVQQHSLRFLPNLKIGEDRHFWFQCSMYAKEIHLVPHIVYRYRQNEGSIMIRFVPDVIEIRTVMFHAFDALVFASEDARLQQQYNTCHVEHIVGCLGSGAYHPDCHWNRKQRIQWLKKLKNQYWVKEMDARLVEQYSGFCFRIGKLFFDYGASDAAYATLDRQLFWHLTTKKRLLRNKLIKCVHRLVNKISFTGAASISDNKPSME